MAAQGIEGMPPVPTKAVMGLPNSQFITSNKDLQHPLPNFLHN